MLVMISLHEISAGLISYASLSTAITSGILIYELGLLNVIDNLYQDTNSEQVEFHGFNINIKLSVPVYT